VREDGKGISCARKKKLREGGVRPSEPRDTLGNPLVAIQKKRSGRHSLGGGTTNNREPVRARGGEEGGNKGGGGPKNTCPVGRPEKTTIKAVGGSFCVVEVGL